MSSPRIQCLLSFDYEIFHGRNSGSYEDVLFAPTERLLGLCDELDVRATWFPDVCSVWWHREQGDADYADRFEAQMRDALRRGHDVQLHVHPHWLFTDRVDGAWQLDASRVYLHEIGWGEGLREAGGVVRAGVDYLEELLRPVVPDYRCESYRAAALALEPSAREHLQCLVDAGIRVDSSVIKGVRSETDTYVVDYRGAPSEVNWSMQPETGWGHAQAKGVYEVPVGTFQVGLPTRLRFLARRLAALRRPTRGGVMNRAGRQTRLGGLWHLVLMNLRYVTGDPWFTLSCDTKGFDAQMLLAGLRSYVERHAPDETVQVSVINHPKLMFEPEYRLLAEFVEGARATYGEEVGFPTFRDVARDRPV